MNNLKYLIGESLENEEYEITIDDFNERTQEYRLNDCPYSRFVGNLWVKESQLDKEKFHRKGEEFTQQEMVESKEDRAAEAIAFLEEKLNVLQAELSMYPDDAVIKEKITVYRQALLTIKFALDLFTDEEKEALRLE